MFAAVDLCCSSMPQSQGHSLSTFDRDVMQNRVFTIEHESLSSTKYTTIVDLGAGETVARSAVLADKRFAFHLWTSPFENW